MPQFYRPQSSWGGAWGKRARCKAGERLPATLARLLMQLHGSSQVSPQSALGNESVRARAHLSGVQAAVCFAGVAQLVEHLFCKQVVAGSSPTASSVQSAPGSTGGHARAFRVLASFSFRSGAHVQKYAPLRSSGKPRQNAELRERVSAGLCAVPCAVLFPHQSASSLARSASRIVSEVSESCPSGQREQAVNLPDLSYAGSNPALSTKRFRLAAGTNRGALRSMVLGRGRGAMSAFAGVAQLVERQPSKLNVEGSSPFSRSASRAPRGTASVRFAFTRATRRYQSRQRYSTHAHLAQMVEHVLGKDEVTSSILVVGSKP